jgi:uncharacterized protein (UPF0548 family)
MDIREMRSMLQFVAPSQGSIQAFLTAQSATTLSYDAVGATRGTLPDGFRVDHRRVLLGYGEEIFRRAREAVLNWRMYPPWVHATCSTGHAEAGAVVAIAARAWGLWSLNACRVIYTVDEPGSVQQFGFAYGTLADHAERGEERFLVEHHAADGSVWFDILAFSRPQAWWARLFAPLVRREQLRFFRDAPRCMVQAVRTEPEPALSTVASGG